MCAHHAAAVRSRPLAVQPRGHLQPAVLLPVGPARSAQATLHVGRPPGVPLVGAAGCKIHTDNGTRVTLRATTIEIAFV